MQLNFPVVFFLLCLVPLGIFLLIRYKYLNKYEELKETPCVSAGGWSAQASGTRIELTRACAPCTRRLKEPDTKPLHPDVLSSTYSQEKGPMHNYLDEFLSAIRVFGFLEKPVSVPTLASCRPRVGTSLPVGRRLYRLN